MDNIFLMYGEEKYLIKEYNKKLIDKYLNEGYKEFNLITIDVSKFTYNKLHENLETLPFFDEFKIVILDNVDLTKSGISSKSNEFDLLSKYIENIPKSTIFIINSYNEKVFKGKLFKKIEKIGNIKNIKKLEYNELYKYIQNNFSKNELEGSKKVIDYIIEKSAYFNKDLTRNLYDLNNELHKIYKNKKNTKLKVSDIEELFTSSFETNIFKLTDAVVARNISSAHRVYLDLINNSSDPFQVFYMIVRSVRNILIVKESVRLGHNNNVISKNHSISSFEINKLKPNTKLWKYNDLKKALHLSYETEVGLKSLSVSSKNQVENYLLKILK